MADQTVHVLFHGLFFMELRKSIFFAITPPVAHDGHSAHEHSQGVPDKRIDWTANIDLSTVLIGAKVNQFPREMPQFSRSKTKVGTLKVIPGALTVTLPLPIKIIPLRIGKFAEFPAKPGKVFNSMKKFANGKFSMVTCLRYQLPDEKRKDWPGGNESNKWHFYAEPHCDPDLPEHLEGALKQSKKIFSNGAKAFDLTVFTDVGHLPPTIELKDPGIGFDLDKSDEKSLGELNHCGGGTNPANCGQLGVTH